MLYHHISTLSDNSLAYQILCQQEHLSLPSVFDEIRSFLAKYEIIDVKSFTKKEWHTFVKRCIENENRESLLEASKRYKKLDYLSLSCEDYEVKPYFYQLNLALSRIKFRERSLTMKYCRLHFSSDKEYLKSAFACPSCQNENDNQVTFYDQLSHWRVCSKYASMRISKDLDDDFQLTNYYSQIIKLRASEQEK